MAKLGAIEFGLNTPKEIADASGMTFGWGAIALLAVVLIAALVLFKGNGKEV